MLVLNSLCKNIFLIFLANSLCFPCLEKWTFKFPVFPVPWQPCPGLDRGCTPGYPCPAQVPGQDGGYPGVLPVETWDGIPPVQTWDGVPPPHPDLGWGSPHPGLDGVKSLPVRTGWVHPPPPVGRQQHSEHFLRGGRHASCVHAGGLSCLLLVTPAGLQYFVSQVAGVERIHGQFLCSFRLKFLRLSVLYCVTCSEVIKALNFTDSNIDLCFNNSTVIHCIDISN